MMQKGMYRADSGMCVGQAGCMYVEEALSAARYGQHIRGEHGREIKVAD